MCSGTGLAQYLAHGVSNGKHRRTRRCPVSLLSLGFRVVTPLGLEPRTSGLKVRCSAIELEGLAVASQSYREVEYLCHTREVCLPRRSLH